MQFNFIALLLLILCSCCDNPITTVLVQDSPPTDSLINQLSPIPTEKPTPQKPKDFLPFERTSIENNLQKK